MTTLAEHVIVAGAENHPLMLEQSMYDSWASRIRLFIKGKKHGRMMLDSIDNGPLVHPTVEENRQTRPMKYSKLTEAQQLQDECDVQATNIILHDLSPDVYALVNHQEAAKDIWDRVKLLMKATELSYQEREFRLYNFFDKFAYVQGETLYEYYWRFSQLINDMHTIGMTMQQVQVNTNVSENITIFKSKFVTNQGEDLIECINKAMAFLSAVASSYAGIGNRGIATTSKGNVAARQPRVVKCYKCQGEGHMARQCTQSKRPRNAACFKEKLMLAIDQEASPILDENATCILATPRGDDPIDAINHVMSFLTAVVTSRYPTTNNQLRNSSNPRIQIILEDKPHRLVITHNAKLMQNLVPFRPFSFLYTQQVEVPKELPKVSMVNTSLKKLKNHLAGFDMVVKERTTAIAIIEGTWRFEHTKAYFRDDITPFVKALKDIFNKFNQDLINELTEVQTVFKQMEHAIEQHRLESKKFEVKLNQVLNENDRLLEQVINKDIVNIVMNFTVDNASMNMHECNMCLKLKTELLNKKDFVKKETYDKLFKNYTNLEKHCISLEVDTQLNQEIFQRDNSVSNQSAPNYDQYF
ncbi:integrase, catalytic region, zinc finger, CCHC-type containing protein [Tanacetum coccineum]